MFVERQILIHHYEGKHNSTLKEKRKIANKNTDGQKESGGSERCRRMRTRMENEDQPNFFRLYILKKTTKIKQQR